MSIGGQAGASRAEEHLAVMRRATALLSSASDFDEVMAQTIAACLPALGDFGFFDVRVGDGVRRTARALAADVEALLRPTTWARQERTDRNLCALSSGASGLHPTIDDAWYRDVATGDAHLALLRELAFRSMLTVPMRYQGELVGALTLFYGASGRAHTADELAFAEDLAALAAPVVVNARLVAEHRASGLAAERARAEAEAASRTKDEFLAILGHELRNPLAPIVTALELMAARDATTFRREREVITRQVGQLSCLVDDLLDVSRITRGKVELAHESLDFIDIVHQQLELTRPLFERGRIEVDRRLTTSAWVTGDRVRLAQVVVNLLTNAAKFTPAGGRVMIEVAHASDDVELVVRDTGIGIPADLLPHVFDLFVQASQPIDRRQGGLGLGLAIVANLVERHGGRVRAESAGKGRGSTFTVALPRLATAPR